jgi:SulP family sulfate permease
VALFVFDYSRTTIVRYSLSGVNFRSNVDRPKLYDELLRTKGELIYILELRGFIFFGTANQLLNQVRQRTDDSHLLPVRFIVLDFRQVSGLDASAVLSFSKMKQLAQAKGFVLVFTNVIPAIARKLEREALTRGDASLWQVFGDLNHGVEWCEEQIIRQIESTGLTARFKTGLQQLEALLPKPGGLQKLQAYCDKMQVEAGQVLIRQGQVPGGLFFVESGGAEAHLKLDDDTSRRLRKIHTGTIVGEVSLYAGTVATASVITDQPGVIYFLSREKLTEMEKQAPELATGLHKFIAQLLSQRLTSATEAMEALLA